MEKVKSRGGWGCCLCWVREEAEVTASPTVPPLSQHRTEDRPEAQSQQPGLES